jgi:hypothetical protein
MGSALMPGLREPQEHDTGPLASTEFEFAQHTSLFLWRGAPPIDIRVAVVWKETGARQPSRFVRKILR